MYASITGIVLRRAAFRNRAKSEKITKLTLNSFRKLSKKSSLFWTRRSQFDGIRSNRLKVSICVSCVPESFVWRELFLEPQESARIELRFSNRTRCVLLLTQNGSGGCSKSRRWKWLERIASQIRLHLILAFWRCFGPTNRSADGHWPIFGELSLKAFKSIKMVLLGPWIFSWNFLLWDCPVA